MRKYVTYQTLREILGAEQECSLLLELGLQARLYKRRREVLKMDPDGNPSDSSFYYQMMVADVRNQEKRVGLNRYDKMVYDTRSGEFWVIAGPGTFECPIRNLMTYTLLGQKVVSFTDDDVECPPDAFALIHGQAGILKTRTGRMITGGDLVLIFSGPVNNPVAHRRYRIGTIAVRNGIDKHGAALGLKRFLGMLLDESGQNGPLKEYFAAEQRQRDEEGAAESAARTARHQVREAKEKVRLLTKERVAGFLAIIIDAVGNGTPGEREFTFGGQTFRIDRPWNGQAEYSVISLVNGRGLEIVPTLTLIGSGALQAWAESVDAVVTHQLVDYYAQESRKALEGVSLTGSHENPDDESGS